MNIFAVRFEKQPDSLMHDWNICLEIVKIAIKRLVNAIKSPFQI